MKLCGMAQLYQRIKRMPLFIMDYFIGLSCCCLYLHLKINDSIFEGRMKRDVVFILFPNALIFTKQILHEKHVTKARCCYCTLGYCSLVTFAGLFFVNKFIENPRMGSFAHWHQTLLLVLS